MRYTAYSSDIGEAFRPVVPQWAVKATYGLAITYIAGEVGVATYKESKKPEGETARTFVHACVFQGLASLAIPMVAIHQLVHAAQSLTKRVGRFQKWGPTIAGLAFIPALPFVIDEPAEHAVVRGDARHPGAALGDGGALGTRGLPGRPSGEGLRHGALLLLGASQRPCPRMGRGGRRRNQRCLVRVERRATKR